MEPISVVMLGATGAVGGQALNALLGAGSKVKKVTLLGRRKVENLPHTEVETNQFEVDIFNPKSYESYLTGHGVAICTLGIGEPSKVSKEQLVKVDKTAVLDFAGKCKKAGIRHFEILSSVDADSSAKLFYLKVKGELNDGLKELDFERLSIFHPSMILTPNNRYGFSQWLFLKLTPLVSPILLGSMIKYRGVKVERLGSAIAQNIFIGKSGVEALHWSEFEEILKSSDQ